MAVCLEPFFDIVWIKQDSASYTDVRNALLVYQVVDLLRTYPDLLRYFANRHECADHLHIRNAITQMPTITPMQKAIVRARANIAGVVSIT